MFNFIWPSQFCLVQGSISISMSLFQTRMCFVCSHLASGHKCGDQQKSNSDVDEILQRTRFSSLFAAGQPQKIPSHEYVYTLHSLHLPFSKLIEHALLCCMQG